MHGDILRRITLKTKNKERTITGVSLSTFQTKFMSKTFAEPVSEYTFYPMHPLISLPYSKQFLHVTGQKGAKIRVEHQFTLLAKPIRDYSMKEAWVTNYGIIKKGMI